MRENAIGTPSAFSCAGLLFLGLLCLMSSVAVRYIHADRGWMREAVMILASASLGASVAAIYRASKCRLGWAASLAIGIVGVALMVGSFGILAGCTCSLLGWPE